MIERLIIPANIGKNRLSTQFGNSQVAGGSGSNEGIDIIDYINEAISEGLIGLGGIPSGSGNLSLGPRTSTTLRIDIDSGTDVILPSATSFLAGLLTATDKVKLDNLTNYIHPNHSGDVTSVGDGVTTITLKSVTNIKLADMLPNSIKTRPFATSGTPLDLTLGNNQLIGRGAGDISALTLGPHLAITGSMIDAIGVTYSDSEAIDAVGNIFLDTADIDFTYDNITPSISAVLTTTTVTPALYGSSSGNAYARFTVNNKGRLTFAETVSINILSGAVTDFSEAVDDRINSFLVAGSNITLSYNDPSNTLTINSLTSFDGLTDVVITSPVNNQMVRFNGTNWVNFTPTFITSPPAAILYDLLQFDGTAWVTLTPVNETFIGITTNLVFLSGVPSVKPKMMVFFNGQLMEEGSDYSVAGNVISFVFILNVDDKVTAVYYTN